MKKMFLVIPAVLLGLLSCGEKNSEQTESKADVADGSVVAAPLTVVSAQIAYVDLDSLLANYDFYIDRNAEIQEKAQKAETELTNKTRALEKSFTSAQEKIEKGLVTRSEAMELQQDLEKQEQSLYEHRDKVQFELSEESQVLMNNIINNIDTFLAEFNADYKYSMILTTSGNAPVLHADPRLNITKIVLDGLNERYAAEKKSDAAGK